MARKRTAIRPTHHYFIDCLLLLNKINFLISGVIILLIKVVNMIDTKGNPKEEVGLLRHNV